MATTKKSTKSTGKPTQKKSGKNSGKNSAKKNNPFFVILVIIVVILAVIWFLGGKPRAEFGADGKFISLYQTEEPLIYHPQDIIPSILGEDESVEYEIQDEAAESGKDAASNENAAPSTKTAESSSSSASTSSAASTAKSKSGTTGSSSADLGYSENNPLFLGNPTDAVAELSYDENYLMIKPQYTLSYNRNTLCPNWVAWHLDSTDIGSADRSDDFRPDAELPSDWYAVRKADYQYNAYGFDRGHVCPSADRTATKEDNSMTFLMTNMVPQSPDNNRVIWMHFENYERTLVSQGNEVYIIAGPYGTGGTGAKGTFDSIPVKTKSGEVLNMNVPAYTWKVVLAIPEGEGDFDRFDENVTAIAINVPNQMGMGKTGDWDQFICSINDIEELTGYDFFELLPDDIEETLESKIYEYVK